jgi:hypothetical protein
MKLPALHGTCNQTDFFIYAACDQQYFTDFGPAFIHSIRANTTANIHIHIFNPAASQLEFCQHHNVGVTWEYVPMELFEHSAERWSSLPAGDPELSRYNRTLTAMSKGQDTGLTQRLQKTYYACARFIRLAELYQQIPMLAVDIDAVVCNSFPDLSSQHDFYIHHISGKRARYLAGGLWLNPSAQCQQFLNAYASELRSWFERDYVYWGLDQDLLDPIVPNFNHGQLPIEYIDWNMQPQSYIWTAKGTRKSLQSFIAAQKKYTA